MAVWLKCGSAELLFEHDIVPRESMLRLVELEQVIEAARAEGASLVAASEVRAAQRLDAAEVEATALLDKATRDASATTRLGYAQGRRDALRHWQAEASRQRQAAAAAYGGQRERLANMVAQATASLLQEENLAVYLDAALSALDALAEKDMVLSVTVHPDDRDVTQAAIDRLQPHWRDGTVVKVLEVATLARGSCICESSQGYVDGSLSLQLAALRQAALGALADLRFPQDLAEPASTSEVGGQVSEKQAQHDRSRSLPTPPSPLFDSRGPGFELDSQEQYGAQDAYDLDDVFDDEPIDDDGATDALAGPTSGDGGGSPW